MSEQIVGNIVSGKVIKITPFGAIVSFNEGKQGLVHISQIANSFVQDINDHIKVNDEVKVKVLSVDPETNRIALSIRAALPKPERSERFHKDKDGDFKPREQRQSYERNSDNQSFFSQGSGNDFEDKMKDFLKQSNDKMASLNKRANRR